MTNTPEGNQERILYVDDEEGLAMLGQEFLEDIGYKVTTALSGSQALELFGADGNGFQVVVTDQTMPEMTGVEMALEMKNRAADIPVVLCSGFNLSLESPGVAESSIRSVLLKTEVFERLPEVLRQLLQGEG